jgi:hypothetical protein
VAWLVRNQHVRLAAFSDVLGTFHPWFHGQASRTVVEAALRPCSTGTFILRLSALSESKYCFLSVKDVQDVKHFMVEANDGDKFGLLGADRNGRPVLRDPPFGGQPRADGAALNSTASLGTGADADKWTAPSERRHGG